MRSAPSILPDDENGKAQKEASERGRQVSDVLNTNVSAPSGMMLRSAREGGLASAIQGGAV